MNKENHVYYLDIGEGRWRGKFNFRVRDFRELLRGQASGTQRALALILHTLDVLPGESKMQGEITCDPKEGKFGVARVEVAIRRFGLEIYRLKGHYALAPDGAGVDINILERFGPTGSPFQYFKPASAVVDRGGERAVYRVPILGDPWVGEYLISSDHRALDAHYESLWGSSREQMFRISPDVPVKGRARRRWDRLLEIARELESLMRRLDERGDQRAVFSYAYSIITRDLAYRLHDMQLRDPDWVVRLARAFSSRYLQAAQRSAGAPRAWRILFQAMDQGELTAVEAFSASMYAHIVWDLPHALLEVGLVDAHGHSHLQDFHAVNDVLVDAINPLQERLGQRYHPLFVWLDLVGRDFDETFSRYGIAAGRAVAWYNAERLADPATNVATSQALERSVQAFLDDLLAKRGALSLPLRALRRGANLLQRTPRNPSSAELQFRAGTPLPDPGTRLLAASHAPVGMGWALHALGNAVPKAKLDALGQVIEETAASLSSLGSAADGLRALARPRTLAELLASADLRKDKDRFGLAASAADLWPAEGRGPALEKLGVTPEQDAAIAELHALIDRTSHGLSKLKPAFVAVSKKLEALGVPASCPLIPTRHRRGDYDPETGIYSATVPAFYRGVELDALEWILDPDRWDEVIDEMVEARYLTPLVNGKKGKLREVVNLLHPLLEHHPLRFVNDLNIEIERKASPKKKTTHYSLAKSYDGTFEVDDGFLSAEEIKGAGVLVVAHKQVKIGHNPLVKAMLTLNPSGLTWMLTHWLDDVAGRQG